MTPYRVLMADDEETFLRATADLLRKAGLACDCAADANTAFRLLHSRNYDVMIADIKMPGNANLEMVDRICNGNSHLPVILVTGYPSTNSACKSLDLLVWAYMIKPVEFTDLLQKVNAAARHHRARQTMMKTAKDLREWQNKLGEIEQMLREAPKGSIDVSVKTFLSLTMYHIVGALTDVQHLTESLTSPDRGEDACRLMACPRLQVLRQAIKGTIDGLEKTKSAFKSRELGALREELEHLLTSDVLSDIDDRHGDVNDP